MPCTSLPTGSRYIAFNGFETQLVMQYTLGSWLLEGKFAYASGQDANDDINNTGIGRRSDVKSFLSLGINASHVFANWFGILGMSEVDNPGTNSPYRAGEGGNLASFS